MNRTPYDTRFNTRDHVSQKYRIHEKEKDEKKDIRENPQGPQEKIMVNREELKEVIIDILKELFPQLWEKSSIE